ncbi:MAG: tRNA (adenosine(37)-N6)-threonylcarbamoyltransferase complex ATPase subunit type 1 TsaE [Gammaproteobacteria bacterium]
MLIRDEAQMRHLGATIIGACDSGGVIALHGNLGTGKTTLVRGALESLGVSKGVRSPTYTLIEYYSLDPFSIAHFDLYRLAHAEELEYLGYRDYLNKATLCFIEWPEHAQDYLSDIGLDIFIDYDVDGRRVKLNAHGDWGNRIIESINL